MWWTLRSRTAAHLPPNLHSGRGVVRSGCTSLPGSGPAPGSSGGPPAGCSPGLPEREPSTRTSRKTRAREWQKPMPAAGSGNERSDDGPGAEQCDGGSWHLTCRRPCAGRRDGSHGRHQPFEPLRSAQSLTARISSIHGVCSIVQGP